jgi:D-inositol-3-phosphate glycosyltransferase
MATKSSPERAASVSLITGGSDKPYVFGLAMALVSEGLVADVVGTDEVYSPEFGASETLGFVNLCKSKGSCSTVVQRVWRWLTYYGQLVRYASTAEPKIFHILWNNKFQTFDRTLLTLLYKLYRKKIVLTVHNVNAAKRDARDSILNRATLRIQYRLADHAFVHTQKMKSELEDEFGVPPAKITVIPFGINNSVPVTQLTSQRAKALLAIKPSEKAILFFGRIRPYKGLEYLVKAFQQIAAKDPTYRLIIAGAPLKDAEEYFENIRSWIEKSGLADRVIVKTEFIPDAQTEVYFKAADLLVLSYKDIFQSGVLFLGYSFGLPVVATDVGSFREEIVEGQTGFISKSCDPVHLAQAIETYFRSDLFRDLESRRQAIKDYANARYSWATVGEMTEQVYAQLLGRTKNEAAGVDSHSCVQRSAMDC